MSNKKKFSVLVHTYNRPEYLSETTEAILNQTYENLELILIDDGATEETKERLFEYQRKDKRVKLLHFEENQFSWDDPLQIIDVCFNAALNMSTGDYIWHQDDDDIIADDYIEKMVDLFEGHPDCTSAAGLPVNMDSEGHVWENQIINRKSNYRSKYMSGYILALEVLNNLDRGTALFSAPGQIFSFRRDALEKYGGFHKAYEIHHIYGIVPFGVTGFDESAYFYWRRHEGQLNKALTSRGYVGTDIILSMINDLDFEKKWKVFGNDTAKYVTKTIRDNRASVAAEQFTTYLVFFQISNCIKIIRDIWFHPKFWLHLPRKLFKKEKLILHLRFIFKKLFFLTKPLIKPLFNIINIKYPKINKKYSLFKKIILKANE